MRILIAEDEPVSRHLLQRTLDGWGFQPIVCADGEEAWRALQQPDRPSVAVLDWMMPGMDGPDVCRAVRAAEFPFQPYLILLTARAGTENLVAGLQAGADDYLTKPVERQELEARLQVAIRVVALQQRLSDRVSELEAAMKKIRQLQGLLPICSYCKRVRDDQNYWNQVETYIADHMDVRFSHGICPTCLERVMADTDREDATDQS